MQQLQTINISIPKSSANHWGFAWTWNLSSLLKNTQQTPFPKTKPKLNPSSFQIKWRGFLKVVNKKVLLTFLIICNLQRKNSVFAKTFAICFPSGKHMFVLFSQICFIYYPTKNKSFQHALKSLLSYVLCNRLLYHFFVQTKSYFFQWNLNDRALIYLFIFFLKKDNYFLKTQNSIQFPIKH